MTQIYKVMLTDTGLARMTQAIAGTGQFQISLVSIGGTDLPNGPTGEEVEAPGLLATRPVQSVTPGFDPEHPNWVRVRALFPANMGGWTIRNAGVRAPNGDLLALTRFPATAKPLLMEGAGFDLTLDLILAVTNDVEVTVAETVIIVDPDAPEPPPQLASVVTLDIPSWYWRAG